MIVEAIERILSLAGPKTIVVTGRDGIDRVFGDRSMIQVDPPPVKPLVVGTLTSFCDFVNAGKDSDACVADYVLVKNQETVEAFSVLEPETMSRRYLISAVVPKISFNFGYMYDLEAFIIALQAYFAPTEHRDQLLSAVSGVKVAKGLTIKDNGISQTVHTESGVSRVENTVLPNPVILKPFRTFLEIDQPESEFVFRMKSTDKDGVGCQLVEADGGAWKILAMQRILSFLDEKLRTDSGLLLLS